MGDAVNHDRNGALRSLPSQPGQGSQRVRVRAGVRHDDVTVAVLGQPQRLRQRVAKRSREPLPSEHTLLDTPAAHRLARQPDRLAVRAPFHIRRVGPQRVHVKHRERRLQSMRRGFQALAALPQHAGGGCRAHVGPSTRSVHAFAKTPSGSSRARMA